MQARQLPRELPRLAGANLAFAYLPRTVGIEAGGDFYDVVVADHRSVWLMIGDVAGHDRFAAGLMGHLRIAARTLSGQVRRPAQLVAALQRSWGLLEMDRMATALFCRLDLRGGELVVASAGHPAPIVVTTAGARFLPIAPAPPLGGPSTARVPEWHGRLRPQQALLLYTDGVIQDRERVVSVDDALSQLVELAAKCPPDPEVLCERVRSAMGSDRSDDVALLSIVRS